MPKIETYCSQCGHQLMRWPINPNTKKPIKNFFCNRECKAKWQLATKTRNGYTREWLINEYINKEKSANEIAKEIGFDSKQVWRWLQDYGIETRKRGHNHDQTLCKDGSVWIGREHKQESREKIRQARIADGHVPYLKDGEHWLKSITDPSEHPSWKGGHTPERQAFYSSQEWIDAVKAVWSRDNAFCQRCGKHHNEAKTRGTFHIHHIISFMYKPLRSDVDNLILVCKDCHLWIHSNKNTNKDFIGEIPNG